MATAALDMGAELEPLESGTEETTEPIESDTEGSTETSSEPTSDLPASQLWGKVKESLKDDPNSLRQVRKAIHFLEDANKKLPDGIGKTLERLEAVKQLADDPDIADAQPFEEIIQNTIAERTFWREFDDKFQAGSPELIGQMVEANLEAFQKLVEPALDKFAEVNPEGFSALVCRSVSGYLNSANLPLKFEVLKMILGESSTDPQVQRVIDEVKGIKGAFDGINEWAKKPITPKAGAVTPETPKTDASLEDRELRVRHDEWLPAIRTKSEALAVAEVQKVAPGKKFTAEEIASIQAKVREEVGARVRANGPYQDRITKLLKANNKTGYQMTVESEHKKIIPGAVKRAVDDVLAKRATAPKKAVTPATKPTPAQEGDVKFERIAGSPATQGLKVDFKRTPHSMLAKNQAFVVGRKNPVRWERK
jgi:hypothetical protein